MIVFLPYSSFSKSVAALDNKRLFKQMIECNTIIDILDNDKKVPYANHPGVLAWKGCTDALKAYFNEALKEWTINRQKKCSFPCYMADLQNMWEEGDDYQTPWWLGREEYHRAMRSRLISKNHDYYLTKHLEWIADSGYNQGMYWYPCKDGRHNFYRQDTKLLLDMPMMAVIPEDNETYRLIYDFSGKSFRVKKIPGGMQLRRFSDHKVINYIFDVTRRVYRDESGFEFHLYPNESSLFYK